MATPSARSISRRRRGGHLRSIPFCHSSSTPSTPGSPIGRSNRRPVMYTPLADNPIMDTDSYKASHWLQYPPDVTSMYSYFESRGGRYRDTVFLGLQYYLLQYPPPPITHAHVDDAASFFAAHGEPFNREGWDYLVDAHGGRFPVRI